jgi:hypothetical protein
LSDPRRKAQGQLNGKEKGRRKKEEADERG